MLGLVVGTACHEEHTLLQSWAWLVALPSLITALLGMELNTCAWGFLEACLEAGAPFPLEMTSYSREPSHLPRTPSLVVRAILPGNKPCLEFGISHEYLKSLADSLVSSLLSETTEGAAVGLTFEALLAYHRPANAETLVELSKRQCGE